MIDDATWLAVKDQLSTVGAAASVRSDTTSAVREDGFGRVHHIICCDFKQLPPATSRPPFIAADPAVLTTFSFRTLKQNRRLAVGSDPDHQCRLDAFHDVLETIAHGRVTPAVRRFFCTAYVRGAGITPDSVPFEGHTAVAAKRRYRDRWNAAVLKRSAKLHGRAQKVKAVFLARGTQDQYARDEAAADIRRSVRSQCLTTLPLAGQWLDDPPLPRAQRPHSMRGMLVANDSVEHGFANGTLGRLT